MKEEHRQLKSQLEKETDAYRDYEVQITSFEAHLEKEKKANPWTSSSKVNRFKAVERKGSFKHQTYIVKAIKGLLKNDERR